MLRAMLLVCLPLSMAAGCALLPVVVPDDATVRRLIVDDVPDLKGKITPARAQMRAAQV